LADVRLSRPGHQPPPTQETHREPALAAQRPGPNLHTIRLSPTIVQDRCKNIFVLDASDYAQRIVEQ
jgi:hypothetical protein